MIKFSHFLLDFKYPFAYDTRPTPERSTFESRVEQKEVSEFEPRTVRRTK
jgi:hypothetical protein